MKRQKLWLTVLALALVWAQPGASAQAVPPMIPHTGTIAVDGTPFNGDGQFKFAIVNPDCVSDPPGAACNTLWSNDNTSTTGDEPLNAVTLPVTDGAFSVKLGDSSLGMEEIPAGVFDDPETYLRVWFDDGVNGPQQLSPDRQLVSVPYAYRSEIADSVRDKDAVINVVGAKADDNPLHHERYTDIEAVKAVDGASLGVPTGAVMFFNLPACPAGWDALPEAEGRYLVGLPGGGTLAAPVGTALTNKENRPAGAHTHSVPTTTSLFCVPLPGGPLCGTRDLLNPTAVDVNTLAFSTTTDAPRTDSGGLTSGTNAPYLQLLVCQKQ